MSLGMHDNQLTGFQMIGTSPLNVLIIVSISCHSDGGWGGWLGLFLQGSVTKVDVANFHIVSISSPLMEVVGILLCRLESFQLHIYLWYFRILNLFLAMFIVLSSFSYLLIRQSQVLFVLSVSGVSRKYWFCVTSNMYMFCS